MAFHSIESSTILTNPPLFRINPFIMSLQFQHVDVAAQLKDKARRKAERQDLAKHSATNHPLCETNHPQQSDPPAYNEELRALGEQDPDKETTGISTDQPCLASTSPVEPAPKDTSIALSHNGCRLPPDESRNLPLPTSSSGVQTPASPAISGSSGNNRTEPSTPNANRDELPTEWELESILQKRVIEGVFYSLVSWKPTLLPERVIHPDLIDAWNNYRHLNISPQIVLKDQPEQWKGLAVGEETIQGTKHYLISWEPTLQHPDDMGNMVELEEVFKAKSRNKRSGHSHTQKAQCPNGVHKRGRGRPRKAPKLHSLAQ
ncbi:hypothetical protein PG999_010117 [Apiospora kogelbergensis]|uniref:Chromo domain-containing protein n=1 Tax=Apiospora kogelbergensis TaxID=1337665 RepID=A0AAW0QMX7_9PEZI